MSELTTDSSKGNRKVKVLYIQHAGALGGSCMSLLYTIQALDKERFYPVVALIRPTSSVVALYRNAGFDVIEWPCIRTFEHTTASWWPLYSPLAWIGGGQTIVGWRKSQKRTIELVAHVKPDLVHLNSLVLVPSALALDKGQIPFVWHVREAPVWGHGGIRRRYISHLLQNLVHETIFISEDDKQNWVKGQRGVVVHNFVNFDQFSCEIDGSLVRTQLGIPTTSKVVLYLGGLSEIKGIFTLLEALAIVRQQNTDLVCLMPSAKYVPSGRIVSRVARRVLPLMGSGTLAQRVKQRIDQLGIRNILRLLPYQVDISSFIAASEVLVFPSIRPHFARPVVEAAAMGKPAVGSDLGGVRELIEDNQTGLLVEPASPAALAEAIISILGDDALARRLGENAYQRARKRFDANQQVKRIMEIYANLVGQ